jgi:hypothetical protein
MKTAKVILLAVVILLAALGLFFLVVIGWDIRTWNADTNFRVAAKQFKVVPFHTNDVWGIGIVETKTGKPLWIEWDYTNNSKEFSYFFHGTNIFNLSLFKGKPLTYSVGFHGPGKSSVWWWDLARGTFIERNFFNTNGDFSKNEVWYDNTWHTVVIRDRKWGIVINGKWQQLTLPTNAMWTVEMTTNK